MNRTVMTKWLVLISVIWLASASSVTASESFRSLKEIREQGVVMQRWESSCAAAALATVLTYAYQDPVSEYYAASRMLEHTQAVKVRSRGGFSMLDMKRFVEQRGYSGNAFKDLTLDDLKLLHAPIVPIRVHGYNHYVVLNALSGNEAWLADPAFGNRTMSVSRFEQIWLGGMAFVVTP